MSHNQTQEYIYLPGYAPKKDSDGLAFTSRNVGPNRTLMEKANTNKNIGERDEITYRGPMA